MWAVIVPDGPDGVQEHEGPQTVLVFTPDGLASTPLWRRRFDCRTDARGFLRVAGFRADDRGRWTASAFWQRPTDEPFVLQTRLGWYDRFTQRVPDWNEDRLNGNRVDIVIYVNRDGPDFGFGFRASPGPVGVTVDPVLAVFVATAGSQASLYGSWPSAQTASAAAERYIGELEELYGKECVIAALRLFFACGSFDYAASNRA